MPECFSTQYGNRLEMGLSRLKDQAALADCFTHLDAQVIKHRMEAEKR